MSIIQGIDLTKSELPGINALLMGPAGTGKTHAIGTLVDTGIDTFYLAMEAGAESLLGYFTDKGKPIPPNLHTHKMAAPKASFAEMKDAAQKINTLSLEGLAKIQDGNRMKYNQFVQLFDVLNNFPDDRTGKKHGPVDEWQQDKVLVIDGMTGLGRAAMSMVIGGKPVRSQSDWGIAQDQLEGLLRMLCDNCPCHFILIGHVERETDEVLGGVKLMISTLGRKLAPKVPSMFSDIIMTVRNGTAWSWDTANAQADVKTRSLPIQSGIKPDFAPMLEKWMVRGGLK
jgi:hypothetical protein